MRTDGAGAAALASPAKRPRRSNAARLFGYDMFISFALGPPPRGTQSYASDLARRLRERDFTVFFSEDEAPPGEPLTSTLRGALHRSRVLVVVANRGTLAEPRWVRAEIEEFRARHPSRPVIPISVGGALQDPSLAAQTEAWLSHAQNIWLDESEEAVANGISSEMLVERLALAPTRVRSNVRWRWAVGWVIAGLALLTTTSIVAALYAAQQRDDAIRQNAIAQAGRLAAQADLLRERGGEADVSVILAAEGVRTLSAIGERSLEVDLSFRRGLALLPQSLRRFDDLNADELRLSPAGDYVTLSGVARHVTVRQLPGGEVRSCNSTDTEAPSASRIRTRIVTAASTNGDWCVVQQFDNVRLATLEVWSARPSRHIDSLTVDSKAGHVYPAISDDGALIAITDRAQSGQPEASTFRVWSLARRTEVLRVEGEEFHGFSPDGRRFATTKGLWQRSGDDRGTPVRVLTWKSPLWRLAFSRDGAHVATQGSFDGDVDVWDVKATRLLYASKAPAGELLALREGARFIIVAGRSGAVMWDGRNETIRGRVPLETKAAAFGPSGPMLLVEELDGLRRPHLRALSIPEWGAALAGTELGPDERALWLGVRGHQIDLLISLDDAIRMETWSFRTGARATAATLPQPGPWAVSADGLRFAVTRGVTVVVGPVGGNSPPIEIAQATVPRVVALNTDGHYLATAAGDVMQVWQIESGKSWKSPPLPGLPVAIKVSRDGAFGFAVVEVGEVTRSGTQYALMRWRLAVPADLVTIDLGRHLGQLSSVCFVSDDGRFVRSEGQRREITAADAKLPIDPDDESECEAAAGRPLRLVRDGMSLVVSDARTARPLARLDHAATVLLSAASAEGTHVATVDEGGSVQVFALEAAELVAQACARAPRELTVEEWSQYLGAAITRDACGRIRAADPLPE